MSSFRQLMMRNKGGGTKTLNLVSVGGATYDSDYIFTKTVNDQTTYFETKEAVDIMNSNNDAVEFKIKFYYEANTNGIFRRATDRNFSGYIYYNGTLWFVLNSNHYDYSLGAIDKWVWLKVQSQKVAGYFRYVAYISFDGTEYTEITSKIINDCPSDKLRFGVGTSSSSDFGFVGKIDFKETDIIINGQSVLWV